MGTRYTQEAKKYLADIMTPALDALFSRASWELSELRSDGLVRTDEGIEFRLTDVLYRDREIPGDEYAPRIVERGLKPGGQEAAGWNKAEAAYMKDILKPAVEAIVARAVWELGRIQPSVRRTPQAVFHQRRELRRQDRVKADKAGN